MDNLLTFHFFAIHISKKIYLFIKSKLVAPVISKYYDLENQLQTNHLIGVIYGFFVLILLELRQ